MRGFCLTAIAAILALGVSAGAAPVVIPVTLNGFNEPNSAGVLGIVGDLDAFGSGSFTIDPDLDTIAWSISYENISGKALTGFHIHGPGATLTTNKPVFIGFPEAGGAVPNGVLAGSQAADGLKLDQILADPVGFYVNIHSDEFRPGAIRGQLPEPGALAMAAGMLGGLALRRRARGQKN